MTLDFTATTSRLASGVTGRVVERDVVWVEGPDARSYLQGQISQDVDPLVAGSATEALLLSPQGKIDGYVRVVMVADERFAVEIESGFGEAVLERLRRFKIRIKATLELDTVAVAEVHGPLATPPSAVLDGVTRIVYEFAGLSGYDLFGQSFLPDGIDEGDEGTFEVAPILAGLPRMGRELTERTIPAEADLLERTVSFTKGCYTGQELVARLDSRGNHVPWNLRAIRVDNDGAVDPETALLVGDEVVGRITSAEYSPSLGATVALGYLKRGFDLSRPVEIVLDGTPVAVVVAELPGRAD